MSDCALLALASSVVLYRVSPPYTLTDHIDLRTRVQGQLHIKALRNDKSSQNRSGYLHLQHAGSGLGGDEVERHREWLPWRTGLSSVWKGSHDLHVQVREWPFSSRGSTKRGGGKSRSTSNVPGSQRTGLCEREANSSSAGQGRVGC